VANQGPNQGKRREKGKAPRTERLLRPKMPTVRGEKFDRTVKQKFRKEPTKSNNPVFLGGGGVV